MRPHATVTALVLLSLTACTTNRAPEAVLEGPDDGRAGEPLTLDASQSSDPDGDAITFAWTLVDSPDGGAASLPTVDAPTATLTPDLPGAYRVRVVVSDGQREDVAERSIAVSPSTAGNAPPVAVVGADRTVRTAAPVSLDGSLSFDPDGGELTYLWSLSSAPAASASSLTGADNAVAQLTPDVEGAYVVELTVSDGTEVDVASLRLDAVLNRAPVADPGAPREIAIGEPYTLDGSGSSDPDGDPLTFLWEVALAPAGSTATIVDADTEAPTLTPDELGEYTIRLTVADGSREASETLTLSAVRNPGGPRSTLYVSPDGDDASSGGPEDPLATVGRAIALAVGTPETRTIVLAEGTYAEPFGHTIGKPLTVRGAGRTNTVLAADGAEVLSLRDDALLTLRELAITDAAPAAKVARGTSLEIRNVSIGCVATCIEAGGLFRYSGGSVRITDSVVAGHGTGTGVSMVTAEQLYAARSSVTGFDIGVQSLTAPSLLEGVTLADHRVGLQVVGEGAGVTMTGGTISGSRIGIDLWAATQVEVSGTTVRDSVEYGVLMKKSSLILRDASVLRSGKSGIRGEGASLLTLVDGTVAHNGRNNPDASDFVNRAGVYLTGSAVLGSNSGGSVVRDNVQDNLVFLDAAEGWLTNFTVARAGQAGVYANTSGRVRAAGGTYSGNNNGFYVSGGTRLDVTGASIASNRFAGLNFGGDTLGVRSTTISRSGRYNLYVRNEPEVLDLRQTASGSNNTLLNGPDTIWAIYDARPEHASSATLQLHGTRYQSPYTFLDLVDGQMSCGPDQHIEPKSAWAIYRIVNRGNCLRN